MPDYTVTDPNGKDHHVTAPDGADDGSILGFVHNTINNIGASLPSLPQGLVDYANAVQDRASSMESTLYNKSGIYHGLKDTVTATSWVYETIKRICGERG